MLGARAGQLEMDVVTEGVSAAAALSPGCATQWRLHAVDASQASSYSHRVFSLQVQRPLLGREPCS